MKEFEELLTPQEAAERKGVSRAAIYEAIRENRLVSVRVLGRLAVRPADLAAYEPGSYGDNVRTKKPRGPGRPRKDAQEAAG